VQWLQFTGCCNSLLLHACRDLFQADRANRVVAAAAETAEAPQETPPRCRGLSPMAAGRQLPPPGGKAQGGHWFVSGDRR